RRLFRAMQMLGDERAEPLGLAPVEPYDGEQVLELLGTEVINLARDLAVDAAGIEHEHFVGALSGLLLVEEPELARDRAGIEKVGADSDHDVHMAGFNQLAANLGLIASGARRLRRHNEAGPAARIQVAVEVLNPEIIRILHTALGLNLAVLFAL